MGCLGAPPAVEGSGGSGGVYSSGGVFDEEQDMDLAERDGVDDEGVTGDDAACLGGEELGPGRARPSRGGVETWRLRMGSAPVFHGPRPSDGPREICPELYAPTSSARALLLQRHKR